MEYMTDGYITSYKHLCVIMHDVKKLQRTAHVAFYATHTIDDLGTDEGLNTIEEAIRAYPCTLKIAAVEWAADGWNIVVTAGHTHSHWAKYELEID